MSSDASQTVPIADNITAQIHYKTCLNDSLSLYDKLLSPVSNSKTAALTDSDLSREHHQTVDAVIRSFRVNFGDADKDLCVKYETELKQELDTKFEDYKTFNHFKHKNELQLEEIERLKEEQELREQEKLHLEETLSKIREENVQFSEPRAPSVSSDPSETVSILEDKDNVSAHINYKSFLNDSLSLYDKSMMSVSNSKTAALTESELSRQHEQNAIAAIDSFRRTVKFGDEQLGSKYEAELRQELDKKFEDYKTFNRFKHQNELEREEIEKLKKEQELREQEKLKLEEALRKIRGENVQLSEHRNEEGDDVQKQQSTWIPSKISSETSQAVPVPEEQDNVSAHINYKTSLNDSLSLYDKLMSSVSNSKTAVLTDSELLSEHQRTVDAAINSFQRTVKVGDEQLGSKYEIQLRQELDKKFEEYKTFNHFKHKNKLEQEEIERLKKEQELREQEKLKLEEALRKIRGENVQLSEPRNEEGDDVQKQQSTSSTSKISPNTSQAVPNLEDQDTISAHINYKSSLNDSLSLYDKLMSSVSNSKTAVLTDTELSREHHLTVEAAINCFRGTVKIGHEGLGAKYETELRQELEKKFEDYKTFNHFKHKNKLEQEEIERLKKEQELREQEKLKLEEALRKIRGENVQFNEPRDERREVPKPTPRLTTSTMSSDASQTFPILQDQDTVSAHINYKSFLNDSLCLYDKLMSSVSSSKTAVLTESELSRTHQQNVNTAIDSFQKTVKFGDETLGKKYETELRQELDKKFEDYKTFNHFKHKNKLEQEEIERLKKEQELREQERLKLEEDLRKIRGENVRFNEPRDERREVPKPTPRLTTSTMSSDASQTVPILQDQDNTSSYTDDDRVARRKRKSKWSRFKKCCKGFLCCCCPNTDP